MVQLLFRVSPVLCYKALCLLLYDSRKWFFGNAVSPMERGTPSSDNQESFFACLIVVKNDSVFHSRNLYNVEFERVFKFCTPAGARGGAGAVCSRPPCRRGGSRSFFARPLSGVSCPARASSRLEQVTGPFLDSHPLSRDRCYIVRCFLCCYWCICFGYLLLLLCLTTKQLKPVGY